MMRWVASVARMGAMTDLYKEMVVQPEWKISFVIYKEVTFLIFVFYVKNHHEKRQSCKFKVRRVNI